MRRSARIQKKQYTPTKQQGRKDIVDSTRVHDRLAELNKRLFVPFTNRLKHDPATDVAHLLIRTASGYQRDREWYTKITLDPSLIESDAARLRDLKLRKATYKLPSPEGDLIITRPLAGQVVRLLGLLDGELGVATSTSSKHSPAQHDAPSAKLLRVVENGTLIWHLCGKFVVRLDENIVVKFAHTMDVDDIIAMEHIKSHAPDMPISVPFGIASIGAFNYIFMSFVKGVSLDKLWPTLTIPLKRSVEAQLNEIMRQLRALPLPSGSALGSGEPRRCKDLRRFTLSVPTRSKPKKP